MFWPNCTLAPRFSDYFFSNEVPINNFCKLIDVLHLLLTISFKFTDLLFRKECVKVFNNVVNNYVTSSLEVLLEHLHISIHYFKIYLRFRRWFRSWFRPLIWLLWFHWWLTPSILIHSFDTFDISYSHGELRLLLLVSNQIPSWGYSAIHLYGRFWVICFLFVSFSFLAQITGSRSVQVLHNLSLKFLAKRGE